MNHPRIVTTYVLLSRPESDFDPSPDVSGIIGTDDLGYPMIERFVCSIPLTERETAKAIDALFDAYRAYKHKYPEPDASDWQEITVPRLVVTPIQFVCKNTGWD